MFMREPEDRPVWHESEMELVSEFGHTSSYDDLREYVVHKQLLGVRETVRNVIRQLNIPVANPEEFDQNNPNYANRYQKWSVTYDGSVGFDKDTLIDERAATWEGGRKTSLLGDRFDRMEFVDVEIVSRILPASEESIREVEAVLESMVAKFDIVPNNHTAGLHVHVGNGTQGFPTTTLRNFALYTTCFERQFNQLHKRDRLRNEYCILPRAAFHPMDRHPFRQAQIIDELGHINEIIYFFTNHRRHKDYPIRYRAYNFMPLALEKRDPTIEFRQHEATFSPERMRRWLMFVLNIVKISHVDNTRDLINFIQKAHVAKGVDRNFHVLDLFNLIGLNHLVPLWHHRTHQHPEKFGWIDAHAPEKSENYSWNGGDEDHRTGQNPFLGVRVPRARADSVQRFLQEPGNSHLANELQGPNRDPRGILIRSVEEPQANWPAQQIWNVSQEGLDEAGNAPEFRRETLPDGYVPWRRPQHQPISQIGGPRFLVRDGPMYVQEDRPSERERRRSRFSLNGPPQPTMVAPLTQATLSSMGQENDERVTRQVGPLFIDEEASRGELQQAASALLMMHQGNGFGSSPNAGPSNAGQR
ncbi:hypothetical protein MMC25_007497 [Agyrium rufum]|nr:hypothetical protein [Agyrium rufum]